MKTLTLWKAALAASLVSWLAACGGGGGDATPSTPLPEVAWASPAVFVTPGAASKSFALTGCTRTTNVNVTNYVPQYSYTTTSTEVTVTNASLLISSNGNISILGQLAPSTASTTVWSQSADTARNLAWSVSGTTQSPTYYLQAGSNARNTSQDINISSGADGNYLEASTSVNESAYPLYTYTYTVVECDMTDKLVLQINADQARAAKNLGSAAGVTTFDDYRVEEGRIEGGNAFWYNGDGSSEFDYMRFNLATGALASSSSTTGTYTPISLSLPSTPTEYGSYAENLQRFNSEFGYQDAKFICINRRREDETGFSVTAAAYGNKFMPVGGERRSMPTRNLESPQAGPSNDCNYFYD
jgi:hypothetical protein